MSFPVNEVLQRRGVPFLFATGYGSGGIEPPCRDRPVIRKPFSLEDLGKAIDRVAA